MMCVILRGGHEIYGNDAWQARRSVEVLGFHRKDKEIHILCSLYIENKLKNNQKNWLHVLHPGNISFEAISSWPIQNHPDEKLRDESFTKKQNILESIYKEGFSENNKGELYQAKGLSAWDSWYDWINEPITHWSKEDIIAGNMIQRKFPETCPKGFVPFTVLELGPFTQKGANLISFIINIKKVCYEKLVSEKPIFTVDGPKNLLLRLERCHINPLPQPEQAIWKRKLAEYEKFIEIGESYDVILLKRPYADNVECVWENGISKAPIQSKPYKYAERYVTRNPSFSLGLGYIDSATQQQKKLFNDIKKVIL